MTGFRTARGRCVVDEENVYIFSSILGALKRNWSGGLLGKFSVLYSVSFLFFGLATLFMVGTVGKMFQIGIVLGIGLSATGIVAYYLYSLRNGFTWKSMISRDSISRIYAEEGATFFTKPRLVLVYERNSETRKRRIWMPEKLLHGKEEFEKGKKTLEEEGFEVVEN